MGITRYRAAKGLLLFVMAAFLFGAAVSAAAGDNPDKWAFSASLNVWLPTIESDLKYSIPPGSSGGPQVETESDGWDVNGAFFLTTEVRKARWFFIADFNYVDISSTESAVKAIDFGGNKISTSLDIGSEVEINAFLTTFGGGYRIVDAEFLKTDMLVGARYLWLEADLDWNLSGTVSGPEQGLTFARAGSYKDDDDFWDGIVGIRGYIPLGKSRFSLPYYADIGTGDSDLTWQLLGAAAYSFQSWDIIAGYRYLEYEGDDDAFIQNLSLSGPIIGAKIRF